MEVIRQWAQRVPEVKRGRGRGAGGHFMDRRVAGHQTPAFWVKKAQGIKLGRRSTIPAKVRQRIKRARGRGNTFQAIAARLNRDGVPTGQGGSEWRPSSVRAVLLTKG